MTPLAIALLYASRYADGRGTGCYDDVIAAAYAAWPKLDARSREQLLERWREEIRANRGEWERAWAVLAPRPTEKKAMGYARAMWPGAAWAVDESEPDAAWVRVEEDGHEGYVTVQATLHLGCVERCGLTVFLGGERVRRFGWVWGLGRHTHARVVSDALARRAKYTGTYAPSVRKARLAGALLRALGEVAP